MSDAGSTDASQQNSIAYAMGVQAPSIKPEIGEWACGVCRNYLGKLQCKGNIFISAVGACMSHCVGFEKERRKDE